MTAAPNETRLPLLLRLARPRPASADSTVRGGALLTRPLDDRPDADPSARWDDDGGNSVAPSEDAAT